MIMETNKEIKIDVPEGMEYYIENDTIKFRPIKKKITYDDIAKELFENKPTWFADTKGNVDAFVPNDHTFSFVNNSTSAKQVQKLLAINKLMNVAKYLNCDWQPNWEEHNDEFKYYIDMYHNIIDIKYTTHYNDSFVYFKSKELAKQAIEILGEETIKLALCTDW